MATAATSTKSDDDCREETNKTLGIMQKVLKELKSGDNKAFMEILEKLLQFSDSFKSTEKSTLQMYIIVNLLDMLRNSNVEKYNNISKHFGDLFIPKELRKFIRNDVTVKEISKLDEGSFGVVYLGELLQSDGSNQQVAVKVLKNNNTASGLQEAKVLAQLAHKNVVKILAYQKKPSKIVFEYMEMGSLRKVVQSHKINTKEFLKVLHDIATGMEYVAGKKFVHRDLDAGNILVSACKVCKIGDFGLARYFGDSKDQQYEEKTEHLHLFHHPLEVSTQKFSTKTDVYSFGVLIWELYECEAQTEPVQDLGLKYMATFSLYVVTSILQRPKLCPIALFDFVKGEMLNGDPKKRPSFTAIRDKIQELMSIPEKKGK